MTGAPRRDAQGACNLAGSGNAQPEGADLAAKLDFLGSPSAYPEPTATVERRETHMSWVFLTDAFVYKLKKPVRYEFLDYSTLANRRACCEAEYRLNLRLAPEVYLGALPLTLEPNGQFAIGGGGQPVDWLVRMRRLPAERMLDAALLHGTATVRDVRRAADHLGTFFAAQPPEYPSEADYLGRFALELARNRRVLRDPAFRLPRGHVHGLLSAMDAALRRERPLLLSRLRGGRVRDGHGDLRPEHVFLGDPPAVIDCLEFDRSFRLLDPFEELAFLAMECELAGGAWAGQAILRRCAAHLGERPPPRLIAFYMAFRACLRARLALAHLHDPSPREPAKWRPKARRYLTLAAAALSRLRPPAGR